MFSGSRNHSHVFCFYFQLHLALHLVRARLDKGTRTLELDWLGIVPRLDTWSDSLSTGCKTALTEPAATF